jgi:CheY-like chemotaxis protein
LQFAVPCSKLPLMTQPLVLLLCEKVLISSQLTARLEDLDYRVQTLTDPGQLLETAEREKPLLVITHVESDHDPICPAIARLRASSSTAHIPVIAFTADGREQLQTAARNAGATLVAPRRAMSNHLNQLLDQALAVD